MVCLTHADVVDSFAFDRESDDLAVSLVLALCEDVWDVEISLELQVVGIREVRAESLDLRSTQACAPGVLHNHLPLNTFL